jgi:hypothetical protein
MPAAKVARLVVGILLLCLPAVPATAQLHSLETDNLRLVYLGPLQQELAPYVAQCFENSLNSQRQLLGYEPWEKVTLVLTDFSDGGNAGAGTVPRNNLSVEISPLNFAYETVSGNERMNWMMSHELVHIAAQDKTGAGDRFFRKLFRGKVVPVAESPESILYFYLTAPRVAAPRWYQEGIATFIETWLAGGLGRAQGAWDEMVFRSMVRDDSYFYDPLGLVSEGTKIDFQVETNSYLYGTRFMSYLAFQYGPEEVLRWVNRTDGTRRYFAAQFKTVFGSPLTEVWRDWIEWEHEFQESNLEAIRQFPTTAYSDLSTRALGSVSRGYLDDEAGKLYAAFNYPGVVAHVGAISVADGSLDRIIDVKDPVIYSVTSLAWDASERMLYYTTDNREHRDLRALDPASGESRTLLKDARVGDLAFNRRDHSLWGVRHFNGIATLVRVPHPYESWQQVHSWPYGEVMYDLDVSPDGRRLSASMGQIDGSHSLRVFDVGRLLEGDSSPIAEMDWGDAIPSNFVFSPDGRYLYGSSYYTGVSNIFRYEPDADEWRAVSNSETGFFRPIPLGGEELIVFRYTGEGFVPARIEATPLEDVGAITFLGAQIAEKHPVVKGWVADSPAEVPIDSMITGQADYRPTRSLGMESIYPVVEGYKDFEAAGLRFNFSDPASLNRVSLTASYTPDEELPSDERLHLDFDFQRYDWRATFKLNAADFYDLFGPTKSSRKGYSLGLGYDKTLLYDRPRRLKLSVDGTFHGDIDTLPDFQNVPVTIDQLATAELRLTYSNLRSSLGHVDDEKGTMFDLLAAASYVDNETIPSIVARFDVGGALPLGHSSIWLRSSAGGAVGDLDDPFANFFFGGFGNNYVDHGEEKRYREYYAFPGVELNEIGGRTFLKSMLEWNLPPLRFRRFGTPGFYVSWARPALFVGGIVTNPEETGARRTVRNVGAQVDLSFTLLSRLEMTLSAGYAIAFEQGERNADEVMISLKVL